MFTINEVFEMVKSLKIEPDFEIDAAVGPDYGWAKAWRLTTGKTLILTNIAGEANLSVAGDEIDQDQDLLKWLVNDDLDLWDGVQDYASVYGCVEEEITTDATIFRILQERFFYGPASKFEWVGNDNGQPLEFESEDDAQEWVEKLEDGDYFLSHNESERPQFTIIGR